MRQMTEAWSVIVEKYIRQFPDQWVWMHNRWKTRVIARSEATPVGQAADGRLVLRCRTVGPAKQSHTEIASAALGTLPRNDDRFISKNQVSG